jgi:hypothetical protein
MARLGWARQQPGMRSWLTSRPTNTSLYQATKFSTVARGSARGGPPSAGGTSGPSCGGSNQTQGGGRARPGGVDTEAPAARMGVS